MMNRVLYIRVFVLCMLFGLLYSYACLSAETMRFVQKYDYRRSVNGKFSGLVYGYTLGSWRMSAPLADGTRDVKAHYWFFEEALEDLSRIVKPVLAELSGNFRLDKSGMPISKYQIAALPLVQGFPAPMPAGAGTGTVYTAPGVLVVDPEGNNKWTRLPILVQYTVGGPVEWSGRPALEVKAKYAVRYKTGSDALGNKNLIGAEGTRDATIYLDRSTGFPLFIRELVSKEQWRFADGKTLENNGFLLTFYEGGVYSYLADSYDERATNTKIDAEKKAEALTQADSLSHAETENTKDIDTDKELLTVETKDTTNNTTNENSNLKDNSNDKAVKQLEALVQEKAPDTKVTVSDTERGVSLNLEALQFVADKAELLPGEDKKLAQLAAILRTLPANQRFLVLGHTADVGTKQSQLVLSQERASRVAKALSALGLEAGRFMVDGKGGTEPLADNATDAGRAKNRRVEIVLL